jgi:hypothetical protein
LSNPASQRLHESLGFRRVGVYRRVGYKLGEWRDLERRELWLREPAGAPEPPRPLPEVLGTGRWALASGAGGLRSG